MAHCPADLYERKPQVVWAVTSCVPRFASGWISGPQIMCAGRRRAHFGSIFNPLWMSVRVCTRVCARACVLSLQGAGPLGFVCDWKDRVDSLSATNAFCKDRQTPPSPVPQIVYFSRRAGTHICWIPGPIPCPFPASLQFASGVIFRRDDLEPSNRDKTVWS